MAEQRLHGDDRSILEVGLGLFGVLDGLGGLPGSDRAAELAARTIAAGCRESPTPSLVALRAACEAAQGLILQARLGATTATVAWVVEDRMHYVSIGDSRLYLQRGGSLRQVTDDQGEGNLVYNALGEPPPSGYSSLTQQSGTLDLSPGDRLLLVTDGITGDFGSERLSLEELEGAAAADEPRAVARALIRIARKRDDRTAVVVFVSAP